MILLASAKTMKPSDITNATIPVFAAKSKIIRKSISALTEEELAKYFKIKGKTLDTTKQYYSNPPQGKVYTSLDGAVFKQVTATDESFIANNLFVLDAMYGILAGTDQIDLFRLDFNTKSLLDETYYNYWRNDVNSYIKEQSHNQLLLLTSDEYTKLLNKSEIDKQIFEIEFDPVIKSTVHKKQARGKIANYCIENKITDYTNLDNSVICEYTLQLQADNIIYITRAN